MPTCYQRRSMGKCLARSLSVVCTVFYMLACTVAWADQSTSTIGNPNTHPLEQTIEYIASRSDYIRTNVRDYTCRLVKRERIDGEIQAYQFANMQVRCEYQHPNGSLQPLSVYMQFHAPKSIKDRRVLYIANQNEGKVLVRKGGGLAKRVKVKVDPLGASAQSESKKPITDVGFDRLLDGLIEQAQADMQRDPTAANTQVSYSQNVIVHNRQCTQIQIVHPQPSGGMEFYMTNLEMDDQLHVPVRLVVYGWPQQNGEEPPVIEEYHYVDLRLNVGLTDADFDQSLLDGPYQPQVAEISRLSR